MCLCVNMYMWMHIQIPLEVEFQAAVSIPTSVMGTTFLSYKEQYRLLVKWIISAASCVIS